jgi:fructose-1,6-bisphosphatase/inositol monophosphatase family enzyme
MNLTSSDLEKLCKLAIEAAKKAGNIISSYTNKQVEVLKKDGASTLATQVVTEVDILSEKTIVEILTPSCREFDLALLAEETTDDKSRLDKDFFWCIDPLDGTLPFTEGRSGYSVSIALISKSGIPQIGVIYNPHDKTLYHAIKGFGAYKNNHAWNLEVNNLKDKPLTFTHNRSFLNLPCYLKVIEELENYSAKNTSESLKIISHGGAAMNAIWALENIPSCYFAFPKPEQGGGSFWDYAATACIYREMGAFVSDIFGNPLALNRKESTFMNHCGVLYASNSELVNTVKKIYTRFK